MFDYCRGRACIGAGGIRSTARGLADGLNKPVTSPRNGFDVLVPVLAFTQGLSQERYVLGEISLLDKAIGPHPFHEAVF